MSATPSTEAVAHLTLANALQSSFAAQRAGHQRRRRIPEPRREADNPAAVLTTA